MTRMPWRISCSSRTRLSTMTISEAKRQRRQRIAQQRRSENRGDDSRACRVPIRRDINTAWQGMASRRTPKPTMRRVRARSGSSRPSV
jgi:hypothetical protein